MAAEDSQLPSAAVDNNTTGEDWRMWCRLCAKEDAQDINVSFAAEQLSNGNGAACKDVHSGSSSLAAAIEKYFWINITRDKELPKCLCSDCFSLVTSLVNFSERVAKVQQLYCYLQHAATSSKLDLHALRVRYGLLDAEREQIHIQQPLPEVYYCETKPKVVELEEKVFETETEPAIESMLTNPTDEQACPEIKIKKENLLDECAEIEEANDCANEEDPFNSNDDTDNENAVEVEATLAHELSSDDDATPKVKKLTLIRKQRKRQSKLCTTKEFDNPLKQHRSEDSIDEEQDTDFPPRTHKAATQRLKSKGEEIFGCIECTENFRLERSYRMHMKHKHNNMTAKPPIRCTECTCVFSTRRELKQHARKHLPPELLPCPYCDQKFTTSWWVRTHIKQEHKDQRPFVCDKCGEAMRAISTLKRHMLTHTDDMPFVCEICKQAFKNKAPLKKHMKIHNLNQHICATCGLQLSSRATLNRHLLVHSDEMRHKCDYCGRAFKRPNELKSHLILHTGLKPYTCNFCERTFANGSNCRSHKKKAHPAELAAQEAAGGWKTYTPNIPKLEALKAAAKVADNLTPVVSKQSGCFAFGRKSKLQPKVTKLLKSSTAEACSSTQLDLNALHSAVPSSALISHDIVTQHFYGELLKQQQVNSAQERPLSTVQEQQQHALLQQQQEHEDISPLHSTNSEASHIMDKHSNASGAQIYSHMRQNLPASYL